MSLGIDTDVLVSWVMTGSARHEDANHIIASEVLERESSLALTPGVIQEFLHVVTDPKRFERPLSMEVALRRAWAIWNSEEVLRVVPGPEVVQRTLELLSRFQLGRKRILDTALAATLEAAGVRRLATFNPGDFRIFDFLEIVGPSVPG
ncbi:MAG TPA: PIN domain-containing protein [Thermoanaerobaculia bacterium]